jgi:hypothetical protein
MKKLKNMFESNRTQSLVELHTKWFQLKFVVGFDPLRYEADFNKYVAKYQEVGINYPDEYLATVFLQKIEGISDVKTPYFHYYSMMTALPDENRTLKYVQEKFRSIDHPKVGTFQRKINERTEQHQRKNNRNNGQEFSEKKESFSGLKRRNDASNEENPDKKKRKLEDRYTTDQIRKLKTMSREEKTKEQCGKCGLYFHKKSDCPNPGRVCYTCWNFGHERAKCRYNNKGELDYSYVNSMFMLNAFTKVVVFLVDSAASHHIVPHQNLLFNFEYYKEPLCVKTAETNAVLYSNGEGYLPIFVSCGNVQSILVLKNVQCIQEISESILSVASIHAQFHTSLTLNVKTGYIFLKKLRQKVALVDMNKNVYKLRACISNNSIPEIRVVNNLALNSPVIRKIANNFYVINSMKGSATVDRTKVGSEGKSNCSVDSSKAISISTTIGTRNQRRKKKRKLSPEETRVLEQEGELWHRRMAHLSASALHKLQYIAQNVGDLICKENINTCLVCAQAKLTKKSCNKERERATRPCQIIHSDLMGKVTPPTFHSRKQYIMCVIDDYTRYCQVFLMKSKCETTACMNEALRFLQARFPGSGQFDVLRCDLGTEYTNAQMSEVLDKYGVVLEDSEPYCHEHNGTSERMNRTIQERARALLFEAGFPAGMWGMAVDVACYLYNRSPHSALDFHTPYEKMFHKLPDLKNICIFGSRVSVKSENIPKGKKFSSRSEVCYLAGFTQTGYRLFDPLTGKTFNSCHVTINETILYKNDFPNHSQETFRLHEPDPVLTLSKTIPTTIFPLAHAGGGPVTASEKVNIPAAQPSLPSKNDMLTQEGNESADDSIYELEVDWSDSDDPQICSINTFVPIESYKYPQCTNPIPTYPNVPLSYSEALSPSNFAQWQPAIQQELEAFKKYKVGKIVPRTKEMRVIPLKWVFTVKETGQVKARLVAIGCRDKTVHSSLETSSPTPSAATVRLVFLLSARHKWNIKQLDVKNAFLNGKLPNNAIKYVSLPPESGADPKKICI